MRTRPIRPTRYSKPQKLVAAIVPALIVTSSITGFVWAHKEVTLVVDGRERTISTQASDVAGVLADAGVELGRSDLVSPAPAADIERGTAIVVRHAIPVTVSAGSEPLELEVVGDTVSDALVAAGLAPTAAGAVEPPLTAALEPGMEITVPDVVVRVETEQEHLEPAVERTTDSSLARGQKKVLDPGRPGRVLRVFRVVVADGVEAAPVLAAEEVVEEPRPRIVAVGTGAPDSATATATHTSVRTSGRRRISVVATGYSPAQPGLSSRTATGAKARYGIVAVDPAVIPLGTRIYVPGYGTAVAADTGGAIRGRRIDLCFDSVAQALAWGRRAVTVVILN